MIYKKIGFTPLQVLNEIKEYIDEEYRGKITFANRLDPMAMGNIHILWSGDKDEKEKLLNLNKEYKVKVLLGVKTDTDDILGLIESVDIEKGSKDFDFNILRKFIGPFNFDYPKYSSPNIKKVLKGINNTESKKQDGNIYSIDVLDLENVKNSEIKNIIFDKLSLCSMEGDFRLEQIKNSWLEFFQKNKNDFKLLNINVKCSRGTYMRSLAYELGGLALEIVRDCE